MKRLGKEGLSAKVWAWPIWCPRMIQMRIGGSIDFVMSPEEAIALAGKLLAAVERVRTEGEEVADVQE